MALSLEEAAHSARRSDDKIAWGVGCHPRFPRALDGFSAERFASLSEHSPLAGEIGLDRGARSAMDVQLNVFRQILQILAAQPRIVSIHSYQACALVLAELRRCPLKAPILHWWVGSAAETSQAVELGCYFSIHAAVARQSKFRSRVPLERVLVESDHGYNDPPAAIPLRVGWVEYLVAQQYRMDVLELRQQVWRNLGAIAAQTGTVGLLPAAFQENFLI